MSRRLALPVALALVFVALLAVPVRAQVDGFQWIIESFDVDVTVDRDGTVHVVEDITVDFRDLERHGIFRVIPVRYDPSPRDLQLELPEGARAADYLRVVEVDNIQVSGSAPTGLHIERPDRFSGRELSIRIGDEDRTVMGRQTYRISYDVRGALNAFEAHDELYWNATGNAWEVPIQHSRVQVAAPRIAEVACFRGLAGSASPCDTAATSGPDRAVFEAANLLPGEGLTLVTAFPRDAVAVPPPILAQRWDAARAFAGSPAAVPVAVLVGILGLAGLGFLVYRQGRDRVTRGGIAVDGTLDPHQPERRPLFSPRVTPVEFRPPDDLRPAQLGVLVDERADPVDITATIVDLAVRGHLVITEVEESSLFRDKTDWRLEQRPSTDPLEPYERRLLSGLFALGPEIKLSEVKGTFAHDYRETQKMLYADASERGYFPRRPDHVRTVWLVVGFVALMLAVGLFVLAMLFTTWAVAVLPLVLLALLLVIGHRWMPHRTAKGSRTLDKALGFREFIVTAEARRAAYAAQENLFIPYLPYAVVFGAVDKWAATFDSVDTDTAAAGVGAWYVGAHPGAFDVGSFSRGLTDFSSAVGTSLPVAPASSGGSGFSGSSGGGFGGGGGGSW